MKQEHWFVRLFFPGMLVITFAVAIFVILFETITPYYFLSKGIDVVSHQGLKTVVEQVCNGPNKP